MNHLSWNTKNEYALPSSTAPHRPCPSVTSVAPHYEDNRYDIRGDSAFSTIGSCDGTIASELQITHQ